MASIQTSKRTACDRCRSQKLRCPARELGTNACTRCIRLGAWCVTSYPRPSGRAGKTGSQALQQSAPYTQPELRPKETEPGASTSTITNSLNSRSRSISGAGIEDLKSNTSAQPGPSKTRSTNLNSKSTNTTALTLQQDSAAKKTTTAQPGSAPIQDAIPEHDYDALPWSVGDDNLDVFGGRHMSNLMADGSICLDRPSGGQMFYDLEDLTSLLSHPSPLAPNNLEGHVHNSKDTGGDTFMNMTAQEPPSRFHILECDPRLSSLLLDMSRRIQQCTAISGPQDSPILDASRSADSSPPAENDMTKLIEEAIGDLSEFLVIIQSYSGDSLDRNDNLKNGTTCKGLRIGIVVIMNLLSAYLQLVSIFDRIFQALCKQLIESSPSSSESMPGLHLTGLSLQAGNVHTKLLSHGILHQFEMIVRLLGMPPELQVTKNSEQSSGLFQDERAQALVAAVNGGKGHRVALDDGCDLRVVGSLRDTIKRVQSLL